jgi:hypothetical protein
MKVVLRYSSGNVIRRITNNKIHTVRPCAQLSKFIRSERRLFDKDGCELATVSRISGNNKNMIRRIIDLPSLQSFDCKRHDS